MAYSIDDPNTTIRRARLIQGKPLLKAFYEDAYYFFLLALNKYCEEVSGKMLEIGSGAGFIKEIIPNVITSEYLDIPTVDIPNCSALNLPFNEKELSAIFMLDVLHHLSNLNTFFTEALRVLKPNGILAMVEPGNTIFSRFIYKYFHNEAFNHSISEWTLSPGGPLSTANIALPWIVFVRDKNIFIEKYPEFKIEVTAPFGPLLYLLSGGVGRETQFLPDRFLPQVRGAETLLTPFNNYFGLFLKIIVRKIT